METTLVRKAQRAAGLEAGHRRIVRPLDFHTDAATDVIFLLKVGKGPFIRRHEIPVEPPKLAVDILVATDGFDAVYGRDLTFVIEPCFLFTADPDEFRIEVIELGREMCSGAGGHSIADAAALDHDDRPTEPYQFIGGRQPRNARADDEHVATLIGGKCRSVDHRAFVHPEGDTAFIADIHACVPFHHRSVGGKVSN